VGNRLTKTEGSAVDTYAYIAGTNIIDTVTNGSTTIYTHDANGNITGIGNRVLIYNQNNRLIRVEEDSVVLGEYTYNGVGQRVIKAVSGAATVFHYDFDGNIIGESDLSGTFSKEYLYRGSSRLALVDVANTELYYYGNDRLGTPQVLTDSTNTVVWEGVYKPFGEVEVNPNSSVVNNFRFPGQYYDQETGLHYNYHRYYDPKTGRYLRADPIGQPLSFTNLYLYADGNPISRTDPFGLKTIDGMNCTKKRSKIIPIFSSGRPFHSYKFGQRVICSDIIIEDTLTCVCEGYWEQVYVDLYKYYLSYEITYTCCSQDGCETDKCKDIIRIEHEEPTIGIEKRYKRLSEKGKVIMYGTTNAAFGGCSACPGGVGAPM